MKYLKTGLKILLIGLSLNTLLLINALADTAIQAMPMVHKVKINAEQASLGAFNINGINFVKLRDLAALVAGTEKQFDVSWDERTHTIELDSQEGYENQHENHSPGRYTKVQTAVPTRSTIHVDGKQMYAKAYNINGNNYFMLRDIGKIFDFRVRWDAAGKIIAVNTNAGYEYSVSEGTASKTLAFAESFESSNLSSIWGKEFATTDHAPRIVSTVAAGGDKSLRVELRSSDPLIAGSKRAEITRKNEKPLQEYWYNFSVFLPDEGAEEYATDPKSSEILVQWHNVPDDGEDWTSPPLSLHTENGKWKIQRWWDDAARTSNSQMLSKKFYANHYLGSYSSDKGKWTHWTFHVRWGWLASQDPVLEVYKNDVLVLNENGKPNTTNDEHGVYMKLGIYKWEWTRESTPSILQKRVVYYDNINIYQPLAENNRTTAQVE